MDAEKGGQRRIERETKRKILKPHLSNKDKLKNKKQYLLLQ